MALYKFVYYYYYLANAYANNVALPAFVRRTPLLLPAGCAAIDRFDTTAANHEQQWHAGAR